MTNKTLSERIAELNEIKKSYMFEPTDNEFFKAMKVIEELQAENKIWQEMVDSTNQTNQALIKRLQENNEECVEPVSIWKDVSELPEVDHDCIICTNKGKMAFTMYQHTDKNFTYQVDEIDSTVSNRSFNPHKMLKYTTLTDFINAFEQMKKDIEELKRNKLEGK